MDRSSVSMMKDETVTRIEDLEDENLALRAALDSMRWRGVDICMIGIAGICLGFLCHDGFIVAYKWLCSWF